MPSKKKPDVVCYLVDGRAVDLSGLAPEEAIARLRELGVTTSEQILRTEHRLRWSEKQIREARRRC